MQAKALLGQSGIPNDVLAKIWALSDMNQDGKLDLEEFVLAMHLVNTKVLGQEIPSEIPAYYQGLHMSKQDF